jgi:hypothetical protein
MPQTPKVTEQNTRRLEECYWYCVLEIDKISNAIEHSIKVMENSEPWPADYDSIASYNQALIEHKDRMEKFKSSFSIEKMKEFMKEMKELAVHCSVVGDST